MKQFSNRIVLLDAHAIIHRAYHAMPDFTTRDGTPTGGLYGVCTMLMKIVEDLRPDYVIACYDLPKPTFRHIAYKEYKDGRKESDEALKKQLESSRDIFAAFNVPIYEKEGFEADDLLGTIAEMLKKDVENEVIIASGDMDTMQLIEGDQVKVYTLKKGLNDTIMYNEEAVVERYGFGSDLIPDYKGLSGDPSDNIIGIKGVGTKTATNLLTTFGTVEDMYIALKKTPEKFTEAKITPRIQGLLTDGETDALFSKELATIKCDVDIEFVLPDATFESGINLSQIGETFRQYEFRTLMTRLKKVLRIKDTETESLFADPGDIDAADLVRAKLGVYVLNPVIAEPTLDDVLRYGEKFEEAYKEIQADIKAANLGFVWEEIEVAIEPITQIMNGVGFVIDQKQLKKLSKDFHKRIDTLEKKIYKAAGETFNIKSTQQLSVVLFETMGLPTKGIKKTPKGVLSTKESELEKLRGEHEVIEDILEYRSLTKLTSTYLDNILPMIDKESGRLRSNFVQTGTTTGRMSSRDPNLQNIPVGGEYGKQIRTMFVSKPDASLVACDYSQVELRMAAQLSADPKLIKVFTDGDDIHTAVAREMFGEETPEGRRKAKVINFGILYGMGATALRKNLGIDDTTAAEAKQYLEDYFDRFPTLAGYLEQTKQFAHENKYTKTLFGRKRFFSDIDSKIPFIRAAAERMAINAPIQGTATADIIKLAMRDVDEWIQSEKLSDHVTLLAQVHDELIFEIDDSHLDRVPEITALMEGVLDKYCKQIKIKPLVPLVVGSAIAKNWAEAK